MRKNRRKFNKNQEENIENLNFYLFICENIVGNFREKRKRIENFAPNKSANF
jgi:hypothetical protein